MAGLLSVAQIAQARAAFKLLDDTFGQSPVEYHKFAGSLDRFNEDRVDTPTTYNLHGLIEYNSFDRNRNDSESGGVEDKSEIKITFNLDRLDEENTGLINPDGTHNFNSETDKFIAQGRLYYVTQILYDGPIEPRNVLIVIYGNQKPKVT